MIKRLCCFILAIVMCATTFASAGELLYSVNATADAKKDTVNHVKLELPAKSTILIEGTTGKILYEENADEKMPPASITKIMTLILVMEALDSGKIKLSDKVTASEHACSMGGTQIWLEENEQMTVEELLKATAVVSANDAAVALGELLAGSEDAFVVLMNNKASELGMKNTTFKNATGLDADGHLSTARDISLMSKELLKHKDITKYSTIWMDSLRDGKNALVNTNKLVRFYKGCTGLKTGTTDGAGACLSASATRDSMELIAVTMGSANSKERFAAARTLLDYGFANFSVAKPKLDTSKIVPVRVIGGIKPMVNITADNILGIVMKKGEDKKIEQKITLATDVQAPVEKNQVVGKISFYLNGEEIATYNIKTDEAIGKMGLVDAILSLLHEMFSLK